MADVHWNSFYYVLLWVYVIKMPVKRRILKLFNWNFECHFLVGLGLPAGIDEGLIILRFYFCAINGSSVKRNCIIGIMQML